MSTAVLNQFQSQLYERICGSKQPFAEVLQGIVDEFEGHPNLFADMLLLLGNIRTSNRQARVYFAQIADHRHKMQALLGHEVDMRVAIMDYFIHVQPKYQHPKIIELIEFEENLHLATLDTLTGLFNRNSFTKHCAAELKRSSRRAYSFALVFIDLDYFKQINDTYGHSQGDKVLLAMGQLLQQSLREEDSAYRYGGEEFVLLLPQTDLQGVRVLLSRVAEGRRAIDTGGGRILNFSAGVAMYPHDGAEINELIDVADQRMYQAKVAGRGRVHLGPEMLPLDL
jgi:diguanylate cyclase (GGDEF)-like protein